MINSSFDQSEIDKDSISARIMMKVHKIIASILSSYTVLFFYSISHKCLNVGYENNRNCGKLKNLEIVEILSLTTF